MEGSVYDRRVDLASELARFDGRNVAPFRRVARHARRAATPARELVAIARRRSPALQIGATWVIKDLLEDGWDPGPRFAGSLVTLLRTVDAPDATLHLLQSLPHVRIPPTREAALLAAIEPALSSEHRFVRAWAYNALGLIAMQNPKLRAKVEQQFAAALRSEALP